MFSEKIWKEIEINTERLLKSGESLSRVRARLYVLIIQFSSQQSFKIYAEQY